MDKSMMQEYPCFTLMLYSHAEVTLWCDPIEFYFSWENAFTSEVAQLFPTLTNNNLASPHYKFITDIWLPAIQFILKY